MLENKRLDLDACKNKVRKARSMQDQQVVSIRLWTMFRNKRNIQESCSLDLKKSFKKRKENVVRTQGDFLDQFPYQVSHLLPNFLSKDDWSKMKIMSPSKVAVCFKKRSDLSKQKEVLGSLR